MRTAWIVTWAVTVLAWLAGSFELAAIFTAVVVGIYIISLRLDPQRPHARCQGRDRRSHTGAIMGDVSHPGCGSRWCVKGYRLRWGARLLMRGLARDLGYLP
jgi:hypothetical protein